MGPKLFVKLMIKDEFFCRRPTIIDFVVFVDIRHWRQHNTAKIPLWLCQSIPDRQRWAQVVVTGKAARHMARADSHHQHYRRV